MRKHQEKYVTKTYTDKVEFAKDYEKLANSDTFALSTETKGDIYIIYYFNGTEIEYYQSNTFYDENGDIINDYDDDEIPSYKPDWIIIAIIFIVGLSLTHSIFSIVKYFVA